MTRYPRVSRGGLPYLNQVENQFFETLEKDMAVVRAVAESLVCPRCGGTGRAYVQVENKLTGAWMQQPGVCSCRQKVKEALDAG